MFSCVLMYDDCFGNLHEILLYPFGGVIISVMLGNCWLVVFLRVSTSPSFCLSYISPVFRMLQEDCWLGLIITNRGAPLLGFEGEKMLQRVLGTHIATPKISCVFSEDRGLTIHSYYSIHGKNQRVALDWYGCPCKCAGELFPFRSKALQDLNVKHKTFWLKQLQRLVLFPDRIQSGDCAK